MLACIITIALFVNVFWCFKIYVINPNQCTKVLIWEIMKNKMCLLGSTTTLRTTTISLMTICPTTLRITIKCRAHLNIMLCRNVECHDS
jgi:hypothetical protein